MNPYAIIGVLLAFAGLGSWAVWERGSAEHWKAQYQTLQVSYKTAAVAAETHAQAIQAQQTADLQRQSKDAISQASSATSKANAVRAVYEGKLAELKKHPKLDLPHECANQPIPAELIP